MSYDEEKTNKLDDLEKKLYSRNASSVINGERSDLKKVDYNFTKNFSEESHLEEVEAGNFDKVASKLAHLAESKSGFLNKFFKISLGFFILASIIAFFVFWGGSNLVSSKNVDILVFGPISIPSGQEVSFDINVVNNNNVDLSSATLLVEYPPGFRSPDDFSKELSREKFNLGVIRSKESYRQNIKPVIFGEKESVKQIKISLEYRVENSSALFYKEKNYEVSISSAPVVITPVYPKEVNSNQEIVFEIEVVSNSQDRIENFLVNLEYPFGFVFKDATPKPSFGENVWKFERLNPNEKKKISLKGTILGQNNEEKVFRIESGTADENDERVIAVVFSKLLESILVKKPFIGLNVSVNNETGDPIVISGGLGSQVNILVRNNLPSRVFNVLTEVELKGNIIDRYSVTPDPGGFFESANNRIIWDKRSINDFADMAPGADSSLSFRFNTLNYQNFRKGEKPEIEIVVKAEAERVLESGSIEKIYSTENQKIVLNSDLSLRGRTVRAFGNLENYGPIPPKVDVPTSYTIEWSIANSFNQVSNAEVRATLPIYVKWKGLYAPSSEKIYFNNLTNEVVWEAGSIFSDTGYGSNPKQVYFQVEFVPSASQIGSEAVILGQSKLTGIDKVTGKRLSAFLAPLNTNFSGDSSFKSGDEKVVR